MDSMTCLQSYFESQNDTEAASLVSELIALLPSKYIDSSSSITDEDHSMNVDQFKTQDLYDQHDIVNDDAREVQSANTNNQQQGEQQPYHQLLENTLLAKESEIEVLKDAVSHWKIRATAAEAQVQQCTDQAELLKKKYQNDLQRMELRYTRNLDTKNDIILSLREQIEWLLGQLEDSQTCRDADSPMAGEPVAAAEDGMKVDSESEIAKTIRINGEAKFDTLMGNLNDIMSAMEQDLLRAQTIHQHQRAQPFETQGSDDDLFMRQVASTIAARNSSSSGKKQTKKSVFFFKRMFKKAFPSKNSALNYAKSHQTASSNSTNNVPSEFPNDEYDEDDSLPRSSTDETLLGSYATVCSTAKKHGSFRPPHIMNILPSLNQRIPI